MITIKAKSYGLDDTRFLSNVIDRGLCGCCEHYSVYYDTYDSACERCTHKIACNDLRSAYYFIIAKSIRMFVEEQATKVDPLELELLDS